MTAAPRPCAARAAISSDSVGATPHEQRGRREQDDPGQQQPPAADDVAEPPDADDQRGDGQQVGEHDPLDVLERGGERLGQCRQGDVGDAGAERRQQHGERQAGQRPATDGPVRARCSVDPVLMASTWMRLAGDSRQWSRRQDRVVAGHGGRRTICTPSRARDAMSGRHGRIDRMAHPISTCSSPSTCCSRRAAWRAPPGACSSARRR